MTTGRVKKWNREELLGDELMAATVGDVHWLQLSLNKAKGKVAVDQNGYNAVHLAALNGRLECLKMLVEDYQMDVNLANPLGWSPIHLILNKECQFRALKCLQYLLQIGADPNVQTNEGLTPLHQAAEVGLLDCIMALVAAGADVTAKDSRGHRPIDLAKIYGHRQCARYLSNVMWEVSQAELFKQMGKLQKLKLVLLDNEKQQAQIHQGEMESIADESFRLWLDRKQLANVLRLSSSFVKPRRSAADHVTSQLRASVKVEGRASDWDSYKLVPSAKPTGPCHSRGRGAGSAQDREKGKAHPVPDPKSRTCPTLRQGVCLPKPVWNPSTNLSSPPTADTSRQQGGDQQLNVNLMLQQHDFGVLYKLARSQYGQHMLKTKVGHKTWPLPSLPLDTIKQQLFPHCVYHRIRIPEEFMAVDVLRLPKKGHVVKDKAEIHMCLREWLEPDTWHITCSHYTHPTGSPSPSVRSRRVQLAHHRDLLRMTTECDGIKPTTRDSTRSAQSDSQSEDRNSTVQGGSAAQPQEEQHHIEPCNL
ncbi:ankyrin repeat domain-containing protein 53 [Hemiscyllium ocellatum]|uniref:ankyrin repeat domain-containing protein 53 n=1 Tax=Hemiscyllium ocellatum TaxID=170820 RepID=UPI002966E5ED|nr:ankyrin repeat domain-containing protein 53 [Hemiscyllium ocellatum]